MEDSDRCSSNNQNLGHSNSLRKRLSFCPEYRQLSVKPENARRITGKSVSMKYFASKVIFVLSFVSPCFLWGDIKFTTTVGLSNLSPRAVTTHQKRQPCCLWCQEGKNTNLCSPESECNRKHHQCQQFWCLTKPPFVSQESISTISPVNCINRIHSCHRKILLGTVHFPDPKTPTTIQAGLCRVVYCYTSPGKTPSDHYKVHKLLLTLQCPF